MDAHFGPWVWEIFVNIEYMYYIHWKTEQHTSCLLWWFFIASFNCSAPQCFVLIGSIYVTIFRGGLVGRQPASQAGWLEEIPRIPNTAHHWETLHSGKTLKNSALEDKHWEILHTVKHCILCTTIHWTLGSIEPLSEYCMVTYQTQHSAELNAWRLKNIQKADGTVLQSEAVWSSL